MPKFDSFTINLVDLDNVIQLVAEKKPAGGAIHLVDATENIEVRDINGMLVGEVKKVTE